MEQHEQLKALRESPGFDALVSLLMEWQRDVFQDFLTTEDEGARLRASVKGKILQDIVVLIDNRIEVGEEYARLQVAEMKAEAERQKNERQRRSREAAFL